MLIKAKFVLLILISGFTDLIRVTSKSSTKLGTYHGEEFQLIKRLYDRSHFFWNVLDIGANNGDWAAEFLNFLPRTGSKILAIEPIKKFYIESHVIQDCRVTFLDCALGLENGTLQIAEIGNGGSAFFGKTILDIFLRKKNTAIQLTHTPGIGYLQGRNSWLTSSRLTPMEWIL